mmetsp:Transcript_10454/g.29388  ORF Transcript_10454/g.29388 Transcript_10454/m.29388 type:complete len:151 (-) Transcript_10454:88-540(-)
MEQRGCCTRAAAAAAAAVTLIFDNKLWHLMMRRFFISTTLAEAPIRSSRQSPCAGSKSRDNATRPPRRQAAGSGGGEHDGTRTALDTADASATMTTMTESRRCVGVTHKQRAVLFAVALPACVHHLASRCSGMCRDTESITTCSQVSAEQ